MYFFKLIVYLKEITLVVFSIEIKQLSRPQQFSNLDLYKC